MNLRKRLRKAVKIINNIKDVAKLANVSIATVSRVVNNQGGYSLATKEKVLQAIKELEYQPNALARGLISKRSETIGILFPEVSSMFTSKILKGVEDTVHHRGSSVIVCNTASNGEKTLKYLKVLQEKRIEGIIFVSEMITEEHYQIISTMKIPVVLVSTESYQYPIPYVKVNDRNAAFSATDYLIRKGHRKIGMVSGNSKDIIAGKPRIEGFLDALRLHHLEDNEGNIIYRDKFLFSDGYEALPKLLEIAPDITAIFAASDEMACGILSAAHQMGIRVPDDISVIGYDNLPLSEMTIPALTTVSQPLEEMGQKAADMLFTMLETRETVDSRIMPHTIIERNSVK